jgi:hypothetical protein
MISASGGAVATKKGRNDRNHPFGEWAIGH